MGNRRLSPSISEIITNVYDGRAFKVCGKSDEVKGSFTTD